METFFNNIKADLLQQTQENLALSQQNLEIVTRALNHPTEKEIEPETETFSEDEKRKAAYALNLCMVSVSQIIDYDDIYILEQEYQAILNNLNLEEMPKDEALLHILKQLLDTITFFRIQEGDKKFLEKEYQQKMKDAIWSAVPQTGLLIAGGNPFDMAISLAAHIGTGYMNYRRTKAKNLLEKEKNEWQLQRSAMEQLNGLRRELFDTAWRLADRYQFPDKYRITEQQITRYNKILLDTDSLRRYERLEYIRDKFEAYPPFWYYLGAAANGVYQDTRYDAEIRGVYKGYACEHFSKFLNQTQRNLLREDQILASGALEYFGLLMDSGSQDRAYMESLIDRAMDAAGEAHDVLELSALSYMQIGASQKAARIFRMLVNDEYNQIVNAQLLSSIYVTEYIDSKSLESKNSYNTLKYRVGAQFLFPMPRSESCDKATLQTSFVQAQRGVLLEKYAFVLKALIQKYAGMYSSYPPDPNEKNRYNDQLKSYDDKADHIFCVLNLLYGTMKGLPFVDSEQFYDQIADKIQENRDCLINSEDAPAVHFEKLTETAFNCAARKIKIKIAELPGMDEISRAESKIRAACTKENIPLPELTLTNPDLYEGQLREAKKFDYRLLGEISNEDQRAKAKRQEMYKCIQGYAGDLLIEDGKKKTVFLYLEGEGDYEKYIGRHPELRGLRNELLAVVNDISISDDDLLLTTAGVIRYGRTGISKVPLNFAPYSSVKETNDRKYKLKIGIIPSLFPYQNDQVDLKKLLDLFKELGSICAKTSTQYQGTTEHDWEIDGMVARVLSTLTEDIDVLMIGYGKS